MVCFADAERIMMFLSCEHAFYAGVGHVYGPSIWPLPWLPPGAGKSSPSERVTAVLRTACLQSWLLAGTQNSDW